jgi:dihydroneopterin aldolase
MSKDQIIISGIKATGFHGVFDHERENGQEFAVDLVVKLAPSNASTSDDLVDTVDYGAISQFVYDRIVGEAFNLIETLAERIAQDVLAMPGVDGIEVTVHKPQAPIPVPFDNVSLRIVRP